MDKMMQHALVIEVNNGKRSIYCLDVKEIAVVLIWWADQLGWKGERIKQNEQQERKDLECYGILYYTSCAACEVYCFCRCQEE